MNTSPSKTPAWARKHKTELIYTGILALIICAFCVNMLTPLVTGGKTFDERSLAVQILIYLSLSFTIWIILGLIAAFSLRLFRQNIDQAGMLGKLIKLIQDLDSSGWIPKLAWVTAILVLAVLVFVNAKIVLFPYQMEYREGAIVLTGQALLKGINPWAIENNPIYINVYGFFYNWLLMPAIWLFGNQVWIYRLGSMLAIFGQIGLLIAVLRGRQVRWSLCAIAAAFLWLGQIYYTTPLARPDALGQLLFLASILIPLLDKYSNRSLVISGILALAGFYTKPYFVLGLAILAAYLFLFINKRKAVLYAAGTALALGISALAVNQLYDAYFLNVVFSHIADTNRFFDYMLKQTGKFIADYWFLLILLFIFAFLALRDVIRKNGSIQLDIRHLNKPLLNSDFSIDLDFFSYLIGSLLVYFSLGRHNGTIQAYYYQLLTPFLLMILLPQIQRLRQYHGITILFLCANLVIHGWQNVKNDIAPYPVEGWQRINAEIDQAQHVMNSPAVVISLIQRDLAVVNSGQSPYYFPLPEQPNYFYPDLDQAQAAGAAYRNAIQSGLINQEYDLFLADAAYQNRNMQRVFQQQYPTKDVVSLSMPHTGQEWSIWVKKPLQRK